MSTDILSTQESSIETTSACAEATAYLLPEPSISSCRSTASGHLQTLCAVAWSLRACIAASATSGAGSCHRKIGEVEAAKESGSWHLAVGSCCWREGSRFEGGTGLAQDPHEEIMFYSVLLAEPRDQASSAAKACQSMP